MECLRMCFGCRKSNAGSTSSSVADTGRRRQANLGKSRGEMEERKEKIEGGMDNMGFQFADLDSDEVSELSPGEYICEKGVVDLGEFSYCAAEELEQQESEYEDEELPIELTPWERFHFFHDWLEESVSRSTMEYPDADTWDEDSIWSEKHMKVLMRKKIKPRRKFSVLMNPNSCWSRNYETVGDDYYFEQRFDDVPFTSQEEKVWRKSDRPGLFRRSMRWIRNQIRPSRVQPLPKTIPDPTVLQIDKLSDPVDEVDPASNSSNDISTGIIVPHENELSSVARSATNSEVVNTSSSPTLDIPELAICPDNESVVLLQLQLQMTNLCYNSIKEEIMQNIQNITSTSTASTVQVQMPIPVQESSGVRKKRRPGPAVLVKKSRPVPTKCFRRQRRQIVSRIDHRDQRECLQIFFICFLFLIVSVASFFLKFYNVLK